jgi:hypothetical protein
MMQLLLEVCPLVVSFLVFYVRLRIKYPLKPKYLGLAINDLCVVSAEEIFTYLEKLDRAEELAPHPYLEWTRRRQQCRVLSTYATGKMLNTANFQAIAFFYLDKIDKAKTLADYDEQDLLVRDLAVLTTELRLKIIQLQVSLKVHEILGLSFDHSGVYELLGDYKSMEIDMAELSHMSEDDQYLAMLLERLGIKDWDGLPDQQISN